MLPPGDQEGELVDALQGVVVEADHHHVDNDPPLDPVLPVEKVELLAVHQLEHLLGREDQRGHDEEDPHDDGGPRDPEEQSKNLERRGGNEEIKPALFKVGVKAVPTDTLVAVNSFNFLKVDLLPGGDLAVPAVVPQDALVGVHQQHEGRVQHSEDQVESETDKEELSDFQPFEMEETFTERMLEQMVVTCLDEGHEHRALTLALVWYQHFVIKLQLAINVVDVVLGQRDGLIQHVLELGKNTRDLADNHREGGGAAIRPDGDVSSVAK